MSTSAPTAPARPLRERLEATHATATNQREEPTMTTPDHWESTRDDATAALVEPIDQSRIKKRTEQKRTYSYIEGHDVIDTANRIFGFGGWSYRVESLESREFSRTRTDRDTGEITETEILLYHATVTVTVGDVHRTDVGVGTSANDKPDAHETAIKGACTDGLKRAFRTFGAQFGNSLYEKTGPSGWGDDAQPTSRPKPQNRRRENPAPVDGDGPEGEPVRLSTENEQALKDRMTELDLDWDDLSRFLELPTKKDGSPGAVTHKRVQTWLDAKAGRSISMLAIGAHDAKSERAELAAERIE